VEGGGSGKHPHSCVLGAGPCKASCIAILGHITLSVHTSSLQAPSLPASHPHNSPGDTGAISLAQSYPQPPPFQVRCFLGPAPTHPVPSSHPELDQLTINQESWDLWEASQTIPHQALVTESEYSLMESPILSSCRRQWCWMNEWAHLISELCNSTRGTFSWRSIVNSILSIQGVIPLGNILIQ